MILYPFFFSSRELNHENTYLWRGTLEDSLQLILIEVAKFLKSYIYRVTVFSLFLFIVADKVAVESAEEERNLFPEIKNEL